MSTTINVQGYLNAVNSPWGELFYQLVWHNLTCEGKKILDYGSGFGITADYLARNNDVTAIEPNEEMLVHRCCEHEYRQIIGGFEQLKKMPDQSYDMIICHNVMEYTDNRAELLREFKRVLKSDGMLSIVKHNKTGKNHAKSCI